VAHLEERLVATCALCGLSCKTNPIERKSAAGTLAFCCIGCINVHEILRESGVLQPGVDPRQTELFKKSLALGLISTNAAEAPAPNQPPGESQTREKLLRVSGMWCGACAWLIEHVLRREPGVTSAEVYFASDLLKVQYDPRFTPPGSLEGRITSLGYQVSDVDDKSRTSQSERKDLLLRLGVASFLWVNVMLLNFSVYAGHFGGVPANLRPYLPYVVMALAAPVVLYSAKPVFHLAWRGLVNRVIRMEALLALGIIAAFGYSAVQSYRGSNHIYFDLACAITALTLIGKWIERSAKEKTASAIGSLYETMPRKARILDTAAQERFVNIDALQTGDTFVVKAGERIPADGVVVEGDSHADESLLTGESAPVAKKAGDRVTGGSINQGGVLRVRVTAVGENTTLAQILRSVENALGKRSAIERNADKAARIAVPVVIVLAALIAFLTGDALRGVTILVIACPCALGIATPLALTSAVGYASRRGILIGDARVLETIRKLDVVVLDKTGTITQGRFELLEVPPHDLANLAAVEQFSEHPLGRAVVSKFQESGQTAQLASGLEVHGGLGISGLIGGRRLYIGRRSLFQDSDQFSNDEIGDGRTVVYYGWDGVASARMVFGDRIRPEARTLLANLKSLGIGTIVVSGDSVAATAWATREVQARGFRAEVLPGGKAEIVEELQQKGLTVAMIGDGINDAPALARADLGIAMGGGTDLAMKAAAVVLMKNDLGRVVEMLDLSRRTLRIVRQNLFWSFSYNGIGLVLAAFGLLNPILASSAMVVSSVCVIANALRLNRAHG
jgi:heavy metal translocating P-type ATPase